MIIESLQASIKIVREEDIALRKLIGAFGSIMLIVAEYIYSLTSGLLGGEETPPEELREKA